jgi:hypothetical protein
VIGGLPLGAIGFEEFPALWPASSGTALELGLEHDAPNPGAAATIARTLHRTRA